MTTPAEQEAERRFPFDGLHPESPDYIRAQDDRVTFMWGTEWAWENPPDHIRELLEAAREYRDAEAAHSKSITPFTRMRWAESKFRLLAAAAALEEA